MSVFCNPLASLLEGGGTVQAVPEGVNSPSQKSKISASPLREGAKAISHIFPALGNPRCRGVGACY